MKNTLLPWYVKLSLATIGGLLAIAAIGVDLVNAYLYGLTTTHTMAALAVIVAAAVVILPMWLELGAPRSLWLLQILCVAFTMNCAYQYYVVSAQQNNVAASTKHTAYTAAEDEKTLARETLTRIKKHGDVDELGTLARNADANLIEAGVNVAKYCKSRRETDACNTAKSTKTAMNTAATLAHTELSDSKSWHDAKATLANATAIQSNGDAVTHDVDIYTLIGALILVQFLASLSGVATRLGAEALRERAAGHKAKSKRIGASVAPTNGGTHQTIADNVVSITAARWLELRAMRGTSMAGGDAKKNYERYTGHKISALQFREALTALLGPDAIQGKNSGYIVKGYSLKPLEAAKKAAVC